MCEQRKKQHLDAHVFLQICVIVKGRAVMHIARACQAVAPHIHRSFKNYIKRTEFVRARAKKKFSRAQHFISYIFFAFFLSARANAFIQFDSVCCTYMYVYVYQVYKVYVKVQLLQTLFYRIIKIKICNFSSKIKILKLRLL